jgi:hypothetical protein
MATRDPAERRNTAPFAMPGASGAFRFPPLHRDGSPFILYARTNVFGPANHVFMPASQSRSHCWIVSDFLLEFLFFWSREKASKVSVVSVVESCTQSEKFPRFVYHGINLRDKHHAVK